MNKILKVIGGLACAFVFCFLAVGYAALHDDLFVNGSLTVTTTPTDISFLDTDAYYFNTTTNELVIKDVYSSGGQFYKVTGIKNDGFSKKKINEAIADNTFSNASGIEWSAIESFYIPKYLETIGNNAFDGLENLRYFSIDEENKSFVTYDWDNGKILFRVDGSENCTELICYPANNTINKDEAKQYYVVPDTVTSINDGAFSNNRDCVAIVTTLYDANAWGSLAENAFMLNTYSSGCDVDSIVWDATVTDENGTATGGYAVHFSDVPANTTELLIQGNIYSGSDVQTSGFATSNITDDIVKFKRDLSVENESGNHAQLYLAGYQKYAFGHITSDKTLEIYNRDGAVLYGGVYLRLEGDETEGKFLENKNLYNLPSGAENFGHLPAEIKNDWTVIKSEITKVIVMDSIAPTTIKCGTETVEAEGESHTSNLTWFNNMTSCTEMDLALLDTKYIKDMSSMFYNCQKLQRIDLTGFNTSSVTTMRWMFRYCTNVTSINLTGCDTSKVTNMRAMFSYCQNLQILTFGDAFDTSEVTTMRAMFEKCNKLENLDLSGFDTTKVTTMQGMFYECSSLKSLDLSKFNTSNVKNMRSMFMYASSLTILDLSKFDTASATTMNQMFTNCYGLTTLTLGDKFNASTVTDMTAMFKGSSSLATLDLSNFNTKNVSSMNKMFMECTALTTIIVSKKFDTTNATSAEMFASCGKLQGGNGTTYSYIKSIDTTKEYYRKKYAVIDGMNGQRGYFTAAEGVTIDTEYVKINGDDSLGEFTYPWIFLNESITVTLANTSITQVTVTCNEVSETVSVTNGVFTVPAKFVTNGAVIDITIDPIE